jgi:dihydrolipoamide dehydrogenase
MSDFEYDLVILGSGPAGYVGAIRASQLGLKTCVVEKDKLGGVCLNIGCIPSKALIHQAEVYTSIPELEALGLKVDRTGFNYKLAFERSRAVADTMSRGVQFLLKKNKVTVIQGEGTITSPTEITLSDGKKVSGKNILIATGSRPKRIPGFEFDGATVLSSNEILMLEKLPKRILILGGGAIGCEFAHVLSSFGVQVIVVEMMDHLLPQEDSETTAILERSFKKRGIAVLTKTKALGMKKTPTGAIVSLEEPDGKKRDEEVDKVLVVVGRDPNTTGIGLESLGIASVRGFIPIHDYYETDVHGVYAAGDVVASPLLAHVASKEAEIAVEHIAGHRTPTRADPDALPGAVFTEPQVASFGINEDRAKKEGLSYSKAVFPYRADGKAVAMGRSEGQVKLLFDPTTHEILGATVVGADATELIHELLLAKSAELLPEDIAAMVHAHPTLSETVMEAARAAEGWAIHI